MNHKDILTRAWHMLWNYKVLWVFGIILALTTSSLPERSIEFGNDDQQQERESLNIQPGDDIGEKIKERIEGDIQEFDLLFNEVLPEQFGETIITIAIVAACVIVFLIILSLIFRYVSETALVKMVDEFELSGTKKTIREGFRLGFSLSAWRLFLIDLVINVPIFVAFLILFVLVLSPVFLWMTKNVVAGIVGTITTIGLFFLVVFLAIIVSAALSLLKRFIYRGCVLEGAGVIDAIKLGYTLVREHFKDVIIMWLILIGIGLGFALLMIPIVLLLLAIGAVVAGVMGLTVGGISSIFAGDTQSLVAGMVAGVPIFFLVLILPVGFLSGLKETYVSSSWTLAYREARALEQLDLEPEAGEETPEVDDSSQA